MPQNVKAYIVLLVLSNIAFYFAKRIATPQISDIQFKKWKTTWLVVTSFAFLSFNYWIFASLTYIYLSSKVSKESSPVALYTLMLPALPPIPALIPGFGIINYLLQINYLIILSLCILIPIFFKFKSSRDKLSMWKVKTDFLVFLFTLMTIKASLITDDTTITEIMRQALLAFLAILLPYYIISRYVRSIEQIKMVFLAFVITCFPAALIGLFEGAKHWLLYSSLVSSYGLNWEFGGYLMRGGSLRASSSFGHSINFGFAMVVALGFYLFIQQFTKSKLYRQIGFAILLLGLIAALARGPWVGAVVLMVIYTYLGKSGLSNTLKLLTAGLMALAIISVTPMGDKVINLIPFVGKVDSQNVDYRKDLFTVSLVVAAKSPWFGNTHFMKEPEMKKMIQGEQIIDIVNTYLRMLLNNGLIGLSIFVGIYFTAIISVYSAMKRIRMINSELHHIGRTLISIIIAIMFMLSSTSSTMIIPYLSCLCVGLCIAYTQIAKKERLLFDLNSLK
ncbi:MAG: O-antigen ligase family protein [Methylophilus sp.]|nr:O-antigen ligase family protein [Methylophilus sp.]